MTSLEEIVSDFKVFLRINLVLSDLTVRDHVRIINFFLKVVGKPIEEIDCQDVRSYLLKYRDKSPKTHNNQIGALKRFFRDYLGRKEVIESYRFREVNITIKPIPNTQQLQMFFQYLPSDRDKALFLL